MTSTSDLKASLTHIQWMTGLVLNNRERIQLGAEFFEDSVKIPELEGAEDERLSLCCGVCDFLHTNTPEEFVWYEVQNVLHSLAILYYAETGGDPVEVQCKTELYYMKNYPVKSPIGIKSLSSNSTAYMREPLWNQEEDYGKNRWEYVEWLNKTVTLELEAFEGEE